jgi:NADP-dependent 3-hydroxy acid dehydrogenase YdfG
LNLLDISVGIGLMMAKALEENGAKVYIVGRRVEVLEKASKEAVCQRSSD